MRPLIWLVILALVAACAAARAEESLTPPPIQNQATQPGAAAAPLSPVEPAVESVAPVPTTEEVYVADYRDYGPAPELLNEVWLNTESPLRLVDLQGKVVLLDMWTFDCINCINIIPYVRQWHQTYASEGLVVIGNHYPEFSYEHDLGNLQAAMVRLDVPYAVAQDNDGATWRAYGNRYWPTIYLIDKRGHIRYTHIGEGGYDRTEQAIQALLRETYTSDPALTVPEAPLNLRPTTTLNVRSGPGIDHSIIGSVNEAMVFVVRGQENGWYQIRYNDGEGYVSGEFVTLSG
jgi:thiol-disulfide isomerase/thioredoxin